MIDDKKSKYLDYDDEYKGIKDLEHLFEEDDKYKGIEDLEHFFKDDNRIMVCYIDWMDYSNISGNWLKKHILWVFWNNNKVTELCKNGYFMVVTMHTQGLKSFAHALVRCFLLENIRQPYQKKNHSHT